MAKLIDGGWYQPKQGEKTYVGVGYKRIVLKDVNSKSEVTTSLGINEKNYISAEALMNIILDSLEAPKEDN